jgi:hypothetical protein
MILLIVAGTAGAFAVLMLLERQRWPGGKGGQQRPSRSRANAGWLSRRRIDAGTGMLPRGSDIVARADALRRPNPEGRTGTIAGRLPETMDNLRIAVAYLVRRRRQTMPRTEVPGWAVALFRQEDAERYAAEWLSHLDELVKAGCLKEARSHRRRLACRALLLGLELRAKQLLRRTPSR